METDTSEVIKLIDFFKSRNYTVVLENNLKVQAYYKSKFDPEEPLELSYTVNLNHEKHFDVYIHNTSSWLKNQSLGEVMYFVDI